jgi:hypothetical protein
VNSGHGTHAWWRPRSPPDLYPSRLDLPDDELVKKTFAAKNGAKVCALWGGDTGGYPMTTVAQADTP